VTGGPLPVEIGAPAGVADLDGFVAAETEERRWEIETLVTADWALRVLHLARTQLDAIDQQAGEFRRQVDEWADHQMRAPLRTVDVMTDRLAAYALRQRAATGAKSVATPHGHVTTRARPARVVIDDTAAVLAWATVAHPELVEVVRRVPPQAVAAAVTITETDTGFVAVDSSTGEVVPGVVVVPSTIGVVVQ